MKIKNVIKLSSLFLKTASMVRLYRAESKEMFDRHTKNLPLDTSQLGWMADMPEYLALVDAAGRWFADSPEELDFYLDKQKNEGATSIVISYVDLPVEEAEKYRVSNAPPIDKVVDIIGSKVKKDNPRLFSRRQDMEFFLPREIANQRKMLVEI